MPKPLKNETKDAFIGRCIPLLIAEGKSKEQAAAICYSIWEDEKKAVAHSKKDILKVYKGEILENNDEKLIIKHFISTESKDRSGHIVIADGMMLDGWPVVLHQHGFDSPGMEPIAKCLSLSIGTNDKGVKGIIAETQYYDGSHLSPPDNTGRRLYEKAKTGVMPYFSIRLTPVETEQTSDGGLIITKWYLVEYSHVGIPCNTEATIIKSLQDEELYKIGVDVVKYIIVKNAEQQNMSNDNKVLVDDQQQPQQQSQSQASQEILLKKIDKIIEMLLIILDKMDALSVSSSKEENPTEKSSVETTNESPIKTAEDIKGLIRSAIKEGIKNGFNF